MPMQRASCSVSPSLSFPLSASAPSLSISARCRAAAHPAAGLSRRLGGRSAAAAASTPRRASTSVASHAPPTVPATSTASCSAPAPAEGASSLAFSQFSSTLLNLARVVLIFCSLCCSHGSLERTGVQGDMAELRSRSCFSRALGPEVGFCSLFAPSFARSFAHFCSRVALPFASLLLQFAAQVCSRLPQVCSLLFPFLPSILLTSCSRAAGGQSRVAHGRDRRCLCRRAVRIRAAFLLALLQAPVR